MEAIKLMLDKSIRWKISLSAPLILDLKLGPGRIVNPLLSMDGKLSIGPIIAEDKFIIFETKTIIITLETCNYDDIDFNKGPLYNEIVQFVQWIRCIAFLFEIDSTTRPVRFERIQNLPEQMPEKFHADKIDKTKGYIRKYFLATYVDVLTARKALEYVDSEISTQIHTVSLVDSISALQKSDYRYCLLYAAIAAESLAAGRLESEYNRRIDGGTGPEIRLVEIPQPGGKSIRKDPVYEMLTSKTDFSALLHERPLYLLKKSLMIENPEVFRQAKRLYSTRNKIVHRGDLGKESDKMFSLTHKDAVKALDCVEKIFTWFGEPYIELPVNLLAEAEFVHWAEDTI